MDMTDDLVREYHRGGFSGNDVQLDMTCAAAAKRPLRRGFLPRMRWAAVGAIVTYTAQKLFGF